MITPRTALLTTLAAPAIVYGAGVPARPLDFAITRWRSDPWARGAYSFLASGAQSSQRDDLGRPISPLYFAGEAVASDHPSTVHGALLSGRRAATEIIASGKRRVGIIGAGFAGLGAAAMLHDAGVEVDIIEARARLGGRVHTATLGNARIDLGASWIHGIEKNPLTELAEETGTAMRVTDWSRMRFYNANGRRRFLPFLPRPAQEAMLAQEYGADIDALSPQAFEEGEAFGGEEVTFPQGYASLIPALLRDYNITMSKPVHRIDWFENGGVTFSFRGGRRAYDAGLVTVPLGVLKSGDLRFVPDLPEPKRAAIASLGMGHLSKVFLRFEAPFWDTDLHAFGYLGDDPSRFSSWINIAQTNGAPILAAFHGGRAADTLETEPDDAIITEAMAVLRRIWG